MLLISCEVSSILTWSEKYLIKSKARRDADLNANPTVAAINNPTNVTFKITDTKLFIPVVTLSTENDNKLLEQIKLGLKITIKWNKCRSEKTNQAKTNKLNYLIDPTFNKFNRLFILSLENKNDRTSHSEHYTPKVEIKNFKVLIDGKIFFMCQ